MTLNCSLLAHTFNKYEWLWDGFLNGAHRYIKESVPKYVGSDVPGHGDHDFRDFKVLYSGEGEWSNRLIRLVKQIDTEYILYIQEDMWPCGPLLSLETMINVMRSMDLYRLQIAPVTQHYSLFGSKLPLYFHQRSKYLVSHQPSIWKRDFLLKCMVAGENPWVNEYEGTKRLNHDPSIYKKIAIYPHDWFKHKCEKGVFVA